MLWGRVRGVCTKQTLPRAKRFRVPSTSPPQTCLHTLPHMLTMVFVHHKVSVGLEGVKSLLSPALQMARVYVALD